MNIETVCKQCTFWQIRLHIQNFNVQSLILTCIITVKIIGLPIHSLGFELGLPRV